MFSTHRHLEIDPILSQKFFEKPASVSMTFDVSYPVPENSDSVETFFDSQNGAIYKDNFKKIAQQLIDWATNNSGDVTKCKAFLNYYVNYKGIDADSNKKNLPLFQSGIPALTPLVAYLKNENIPLNFRINVGKNLTAGINVCGPGTYTNIIKAYMDLFAYLNPSMRWASIRKNIAEQHVLQIIHDFNFSVSTIWEIHYVNAVINHFQDMLSISAVADEYANRCSDSIKKDIIDVFKDSIKLKLNARTLIETLMTEVDLEGFLHNIKTTPSSYEDQQADFESRLNLIGPESHQYLYLDDVIDYDDKASFTLSWKAKYILFISIFNRLVQQKILAVEAKIVDLTNATIHYLSTHTLAMTHVQIRSNESPETSHDRLYQAFIPYCIQSFNAKDKYGQEELLKFIQTNLTAQQKEELQQAINEYLTSKEYNDLESKDKISIKENLLSIASLLHAKNMLINKLSYKTLFFTITSSVCTWCLEKENKKYILFTDALWCSFTGTSAESMIDWQTPIQSNGISDENRIEIIEFLLRNLALESSDTPITLDKLQKVLDFILKIRPTHYEYKNIFNLLSPERRIILLQKISSDDNLTKLIEQIRDLKDFKYYLNLMHKDPSIFLKVLGEEKINTLINNKHTLFDTLRGIDKIHHLPLLLSSQGVRNLIDDLDRFIKIIKISPENNWAILRLFTSDKIFSYIKTIEDIRDLLHHFQNQQDQLLALLGDKLTTLLTAENLCITLKYVKNEYRMSLLYKLNLPALITTPDQFTNLISLLDEESLVYLLYTLNAGKIRSLIPDAEHFTRFLKDTDQLKLSLPLQEILLSHLPSDYFNFIFVNLQHIQSACFCAQTKNLEMILLNKLGQKKIQGLIKNPSDLAKLLTGCHFSQEFLLVFLDKSYLKSLISDTTTLGNILKVLRNDAPMLLLTMLDLNKIHSQLTDIRELAPILSTLSTHRQAYEFYITSISDQTLSLLFSKYSHFRACLQLSAFVATDIEPLISRLPSEKLKTIFTNPENLRAILLDTHISYAKKMAFIASRPSEILHIISCMDSFTALLSPFKKEDMIKIINNFTQPHLKKIYSSPTGKFNFDNCLEFINKLTHLPMVQDVLLLGLNRLYRARREKDTRRFTSMVGPFFGSPRDVKLSTSDILEEAILKNNKNFKENLSKEQLEALKGGKLGRCSRSFTRT